MYYIFLDNPSPPPITPLPPPNTLAVIYYHTTLSLPLSLHYLKENKKKTKTKQTKGNE